jgi:hypothetical protein
MASSLIGINDRNRPESNRNPAHEKQEARLSKLEAMGPHFALHSSPQASEVGRSRVEGAGLGVNLLRFRDEAANRTEPPGMATEKQGQPACPNVERFCPGTTRSNRQGWGQTLQTGFSMASCWLSWWGLDCVSEGLSLRELLLGVPARREEQAYCTWQCWLNPIQPANRMCLEKRTKETLHEADRLGG